jgi:hypothetical protein
LPSGIALCITDTASIPWTFSGDTEGGMDDERRTEWLIFAAERDSMQVFIASARASYLWMSPPSAAGFVAEHAINDASWIRARFGHAGTYVFSARITSDSVAPYELRVAPVIATGASRPIGKSATLMIEADSSRRIAIVPAAMSRGLDSDSAWRRFAVPPGPYRMLLVRDTTYLACALPCNSPRQFTAHPAQAVTIRP